MSKKLTGVFLQCEHCGKEIYKTQTNYRRHKHHYCSNTCQLAHQRLDQFEIRNCEICNKEFECSKKSKQRFCCNACQNVWQRTRTGELNPKFESVLTPCEYCGQMHYVMPYKLNSGQHLFCSTECRRAWYAETWSQSEEWKSESRTRAIRMLQEGAFGTNTKPQIITNQILDNLDIKYENEYDCKYYAVDNYLVDYNLMIEVMGDYWHSNPLSYENTDQLNEVQRTRITKDKAKHTYLLNNFNINVLYLWETDLYVNPELCEELIKKYIDCNGQIENYNSFNYHMEENTIALNDNIIYPFYEDAVNA